jgi:pimeloyl-ACP methyl ester carboxylesterase
MRERDVLTTDGRVLHTYDLGPAERSDELVVLWQHGTPNTGAPPEPLFEAARPLGIRWIGYDRPSYGGSTPHPDATIATAAADARQIADQLGIGRFTVFGHSGGGPRALACGALIPDRVVAVVSVSSPAPWPAPGLDYFAGMSDGGARELRAAARGRAELKRSWRRMNSTPNPSSQPIMRRSRAPGRGSTASSRPRQPMGLTAWLQILSAQWPNGALIRQRSAHRR